MDNTKQKQIIDILDKNRTMTIATVRPDGWPQATTVGYAHEGMTLYFLCGPDSQKARNIAKDNRVSITVDQDEAQVMRITGLSMAARAAKIDDPKEAQRIMDLLIARYPQQEISPGQLPPASAVSLFSVKPVVVSLLDYTKGFGHVELLAVDQ